MKHGDVPKAGKLSKEELKKGVRNMKERIRKCQRSLKRPKEGLRIQNSKSPKKDLG